MYDLDITEVYGISDYSKSKIKDASIAFKYDKEDEVFMSASHESEAFLNFSKEMGYVFKPYNGPEHEDCLLLDRKSINVHWLKSNEYERLEESVIAFYKFQVTELIQKLKDEEDSKDKNLNTEKE